MAITNAARPTVTTRPSIVARIPAPGTASNAAASGNGHPAVLAERRGRRPPRAGAPIRARRRRRGAATSASSTPSATTTSVTCGRPSVSVPVLSSTTAPTLSSRSRASRVPEQDSVLGALPGPDHDRGRRRQAEGARAGDDQHRDGVEQRQVERRLGSQEQPGDERQRRDAEDGRHELRRSRRRRAAGSGHGIPAPPRPAARSGRGPSRHRPAWPRRRTTRCR